MIYTLSLNPAIDEFCWKKRMLAFAGGKGVNVTRALRKFGSRSKALIVLGGETGGIYQRLIVKEGIDVDLINCSAPTRINRMDVLSKTRVVDSGALWSKSDTANIKKHLKGYMPSEHFWIVSGRAPFNSERVYRQIIDCLKVKQLVLDVNGKMLKSMCKSRPFLIKPNQEEAEECLGRKIKTEQDIARALKEFQRKGAKNIVLSLGANGVAASIDDEGYRVKLRRQYSNVSDIGCGDILLAGIVAFWQDPVNVRLMQGVAAATAGLKQWKPGYFLKKDCRQIMPEIEVAKLA